MSNKWMITLYILPALLLLVVLIYIPLVLSGYYGLMEWDGVSDMKFIGLENYITGIQDKKFWSSAYHSFLLALFSALSLLVYMAISLILASNIKGSDILRKIYWIVNSKSDNFIKGFLTILNRCQVSQCSVNPMLVEPVDVIVQFHL